jgi:hypothetical protein
MKSKNIETATASVRSKRCYTCRCGRVTTRRNRCNACRQKAHRERLRIATPILQVISIFRLDRELSERVIAKRDGTRLPATTWLRRSLLPEHPRARVKVTSRHPVSNTLYRIGVPVDMSDSSIEVIRHVAQRKLEKGTKARD